MVTFVVRIVLLSAIFLTLWLLGLPLAVDIFIAFFVFIVGLAISPVNLLCFFVSLALGSFAIHTFLASGIATPTQFYREHERYQKDGRYEALVKNTIQNPYGDIAAVDPMVPESLKEPRTVYFQTDSLGYRNRQEFSNQSYIFNGDSFVVGNGTTQEEALSDVLAKYGVSNYNIAFPSDPDAYDARAVNFLNGHLGNYTFATFYFEGNDFVANPSEDAPPKPSKWERYYEKSDEYDIFRIRTIKRWATNLNYPLLLTGMRQRLERRYVRTSANMTTLYSINGTQLGFLDPHSQVSRARSVRMLPVELNPAVLARTKCVFLIPTKLRVYSPFFAKEISQTIPETSAALLALQEKYKDSKVDVVDLTPALRNQAAALLGENKYVFWRDDTHWNGNGVQAVASTVKSCLEPSEVMSD